jgi:hypothetical protein
MATQGLIKCFVVTVTYGGVNTKAYAFRQKRKAKSFFISFITKLFPNVTEEKLNDILNKEYNNYWKPHWQNFEGFTPKQREDIIVILQESCMEEI